ncbi:hypothetical protein [Glutamicibacter arilaitensis]|uniref:hypothetical protein n=1 Tax=Glutamicibacter arilaitensis TaxID=256701 RepID=UPI003FD01B33
MDTDTAVEAQLATVWTTPQGAPARLVWNQRRFIVYTRPIPWSARIPWWETAPASRKTSGEPMVEQAMWQVQAKALDDGEMLIFDLAVSDGPRWPVRAIFD